MTYQTRIVVRPLRSRAALLTEGVSSIDLNQRMTIARKSIGKGSLADDWKAVGGDIKAAVRGIKREFEAA